MRKKVFEYEFKDQHGQAKIEIFEVRNEEKDKDKDSLNYLLEEAGYSEKESIKIMNIVDLVWKNKNDEIERTDALNYYIQKSGCSEKANMLIIAISDWILKHDLRLGNAWRNVFEVIINMAEKGGLD